MGKILSYYDLCDIPYGHDGVDKDLDFSEFMTEEELEVAELRRQEREEEARRKKEEEEWSVQLELRKQKEAEEERAKAAWQRKKQVTIFINENIKKLYIFFTRI